MKIKKLFRKPFIDEQIDYVEAHIRRCKFGTIEYGRWLDIREKLIKQKKAEQKQIPWKDVADVGLRVVEIGGNFVLIWAGYKLYKDTARMSYGFDEEMRLCNGRVFNMKDNFTKLAPKKV